MRLRRGVWIGSDTSSGLWFSHDRAWVFRRTTPGWRIEACASDAATGMDGKRSRAKQLEQVGLGVGTHFKTRREAVAALELLLAGYPVEVNG